MLTDLIVGMVFTGNVNAVPMLPVIAWQRATFSAWHLPVRIIRRALLDEQTAVVKSPQAMAQRALANEHAREFHSSSCAVRARNSRIPSRAASSDAEHQNRDRRGSRRGRCQHGARL